MNNPTTRFWIILRYFVLVPLIALGVLSILATGGSSGGGGGGAPPPDDGGGGDGGSAPTAILSPDQTNLIANNGNPDYLTISDNSAEGRREEGWTYIKLGKTYLFWDGARVKEEAVSTNSGNFSNPPFIDPALFAKATTRTHIRQTFGENFTSVDQSAGALEFETWYFEDQGLVVSFSGDELVVVQTIDKP